MRAEKTKRVIPRRDNVASFDVQLHIRESMAPQEIEKNGFRARALRGASRNDVARKATGSLRRVRSSR